MPPPPTVLRRHLARRKYSKAGVAASKIQVAYRVHLMRQSLLERLHAARRERDSRFQVRLACESRVTVSLVWCRMTAAVSALQTGHGRSDVELPAPVSSHC